MASGSGNNVSKILQKRGVLSEDPIENEYENLDEDEDADEDVASENVTKKVLGAQEPATITRYDDIKITPFNLEDELEEGEFDKTGNFVFKKPEKSDYDKNDTWADSVDWEEVERKQTKAADAMSIGPDDDGEEASQPQEDKSRFSCYKQMLRIMRPDETVQKTIKRIGNDIPKRRPMQKSRNKPSMPVDTSDQEAIKEARKKLDSMIELAHHLLEGGDIDIYQKSYEQLEEAINS